MATITEVTARQILDSRGVPTVEVTVSLDSGIQASSSAPSGSMANKQEALELRDHDSNQYFGQGVSKAVNNVNTEINSKLRGMDPLYQTQIDQTLVNLDGTANKSRLGANAILATSQAVMKVAAKSLKLPLFMYVKEKYQLIDAYRIPTPIFNLINGGRHGSGALDFQEFQLVPASHLQYSQALKIGVELFMAMDRILEQKGAIRTVGVEGGFSPNLATNADALEIFTEAMKLTSYSLAQDAFLGIDVAPRWFHKNGKYTVKDRPQPMNGKTMIKYYQDLHHQYRVFSFEDPLMPDAWEDWKFMTSEMGQTAMIVADDLITTNKTLLMKAIQEKSCNAVVIKPNRVGTLTETIEVLALAKQAGWHTIMSHRSGETTDDVLADVSVGVGTDYVKFGAPSRGERVAKYNRLLRIEEILLRSINTQETSGVQPMTAPADFPMASTTTTAPSDSASTPFSPSVNAAPAVSEPTLTPANSTPTVPMPAAPSVSETPTSSQPASNGLPPFSKIFASANGAPTTPTPANPFISPAPAMPTPSPVTTPVTPPPAPEPTPLAPNPAPVEPLTPTPVSTPEPTPITPPTPITGTPVPTITPPAGVAPLPAGPVDEGAEKDLQNSLNELVQMAGNPSVAPAVAAPAVASSAGPAFPGGLTPPTPPSAE